MRAAPQGRAQHGDCHRGWLFWVTKFTLCLRSSQVGGEGQKGRGVRVGKVRVRGCCVSQCLSGRLFRGYFAVGRFTGFGIRVSKRKPEEAISTLPASGPDPLITNHPDAHRALRLPSRYMSVAENATGLKTVISCLIQT